MENTHGNIASTGLDNSHDSDRGLIMIMIHCSFVTIVTVPPVTRRDRDRISGRDPQPSRYRPWYRLPSPASAAGRSRLASEQPEDYQSRRLAPRRVRAASSESKFDLINLKSENDDPILQIADSESDGGC